MDIDDVGFDRAASVIIEAEPRDRLAADVVEKDVGGRDQAAQHFGIFGLFQIERDRAFAARSEEHTSELQSLMRISYAVFCLKKKNKEYDVISQVTIEYT